MMLDNFTRSELDTCCRTLKEKYGEKASAGQGVIGKRKFLIEVSGGVTPENFEELAHPGEFGTYRPSSYQYENAKRLTMWVT